MKLISKIFLFEDFMIKIVIYGKLTKNIYQMIIDADYRREHWQNKVKCLAIVIRFNQNGVVRDRFLQLIELTALTASAIFAAVLATLKEHNLPLSNMIGFAADNASVMMGATGGVRALFLEKNPNIFVLGCICHSFALCSEAACEMIPTSIEELIRNVYAYFSKSSARRHDFESHQKMANITPHRLLRLSQTRWLSLEVSSTLDIQ